MENLARRILHSKHVIFITGAGISAASGVSTYRGKNGIYTKSLIPPQILMSKTVMDLCPSVIWKHIKSLCSNKTVKPNIAHRVISDLECFVKVTVVTQNVDGLHSLAGSKNVIELHGNIRSLNCTKCDYKDLEPDYDSLPKLPKCPRCKAVLRPPVVLFGEILPEKAINDYEKAINDNPDIIIYVGTTGSFQYIIAPALLAEELGIHTVLIDPNPNKIFTNIIKEIIKEPAETTLPKLMKEVVKQRSII